MINEYLYTDADEQEQDEVPAEPSVNKTLFIIQLTEDMPVRPETMENLTSLAAVFDHYKPSSSCELCTVDESVATETVHFKSLEDFHPAKILEHSPGQQEIVQLKEKLSAMSKMIVSNSRFGSMLAKPGGKNNITMMLKLLINDLAKEAL